MLPPIFVECYVIASLAFHRLAIGFVLAYPATLTAGITGNTTDVRATMDEAAWIASAYNITGALGFFILPTIMQMYGRKLINVINNVITVVGSIIIANASSIPELIAGRTIQGIGFCGLFLNVQIAAEYSHPKRRGFFIAFKGTATVTGILLCHGLGFALTWRKIAWLMSIPAAISALSTIFWPESPLWLANKGRYDECVTNFEILRGKSLNSKKELEELITTQMEVRKMMNYSKNNILKIILVLGKKEFLKPFAVLLVLVIAAHAMGMYYLLAYVIEIMQILSGDHSKTMYYTIGFDAIKILAMLISSGIINFFNRRSVLFGSGALACLLLSLVCILDYLESIDVLALRWLTPSLLIVYNFVLQTGVLSIYVILLGELIPMEFKSIGTTLIGVFYSLMGFLTLKFTPKLLVYTDVYGTFAVYLTVAIICMTCLYIFLPETKDKTLQQIEKCFINIQVNNECNLQEITKFKI